MSYAGFGNLDGGFETVDEVAGHTDMMGQASVMNQAGNGKATWKNDATKSLLALWAFMLLSYWLVGFFFRQYLV